MGEEIQDGRAEDNIRAIFWQPGFLSGVPAGQRSKTHAGCGFGCKVGRIAPTPFTYGSAKTEDGRVCMYLGEGRFTNDPIPDDFFGCPGVAQIPGLQDKLQVIGYNGYRHHTSVTPGHVAGPVCEAMEKYLGYKATLL